jgi:hypothetical protein
MDKHEMEVITVEVVAPIQEMENKIYREFKGSK